MSGRKNENAHCGVKSEKRTLRRKCSCYPHSICNSTFNHFVMESESRKQNISTKAESTLRIVANIILLLGMATTILLLFSVAIVEDPSQHYKDVFSPVGFGVAVGVFLSALATWAVLRVIANISCRLKNIQDFLCPGMVAPMHTHNEIPNQAREMQQPTSIGGTYLMTEAENTEDDMGSVPDLKVKVGDYVISVKDNAKYEVRSTDGDKACVQRGLLGGFTWLGPTEYRKA